MRSLRRERTGMDAPAFLAVVVLVGVVGLGSACTSGRADDTKRDAGALLEDGRDAARATTDKTREVAGEVAAKSKDLALATGAALTDGWVTAKVKVKFSDETVLQDSDISVDTADHQVTLKGRVRSNAASARAGEIAAGTEGVSRVVNLLVVNQP